MRNLLSLLLFALLFTACDKNETKEPKDAWNSFVSIKPDASFQLKSTLPGLTPEEIVRNAYGMDLRSHWGDNEYFEEAYWGNRGIPEFIKDYENYIIKMWATDIIGGEGSAIEGELRNDFLKAFDVFIVDKNHDTIAYIPNETLRAAESLIEAAFAVEDYDEVQRLFDEAYTYKAIE